ncbi:MAG: folylpolyglutamate synthase/dihydrofolate synthase family protein [Thermodesulfobacteriota bacterium]|nr:folylpolyglutamate synthase/dihydrofolate synthase family protein [Thermodesulfobacteriota bacterium]
MISSIDDHLSALYRLRRFGIQLGLTTISRLMKGLGNPEDQYACIHVAGTNGKGSVASFLSSVLVCAGYKVGLYTSPHLIRFNERIQINGNSISDNDVAGAAEAVQRIYTQGEPPTFFECATAMALYHFAVKKVNWAVLETGMGGRYDATNVVRSQACVISNISMEHTEYLGHTLKRIAAEKAGIIKENAGVVTGTRQKSALQVIEQAATEKGVPLLRIGKEIKVHKSTHGRFTCLGKAHTWQGLKAGLLGDHQMINAALALGALELLMEKGLEVTDEAIYKGLAQTRWPGRLEAVSTDPFVLLDGAHNPSAVKTLKAYLKNRVVYRRLILVLGILKDKAWRPMLRELAGISHRMILTRPQYERAADPADLSSFVRCLKQDFVVIPHLVDAISLALDEAGHGDLVCITGSLYTVGEAKAYFENSYATS